MNRLACIVQDILTVKGGVIFHQVNTLGVMGAGLALRTVWENGRLLVDDTFEQIRARVQ